MERRETDETEKEREERIGTSVSGTFREEEKPVCILHKCAYMYVVSSLFYRNGISTELFRSNIFYIYYNIYILYVHINVHMHLRFHFSCCVKFAAMLLLFNGAKSGRAYLPKYNQTRGTCVGLSLSRWMVSSQHNFSCKNKGS